MWSLSLELHGLENSKKWPSQLFCYIYRKKTKRDTERQLKQRKWFCLNLKGPWKAQGLTIPNWWYCSGRLGDLQVEGKSWWRAVAVRKHLRGNLAPSLAAPSPLLDLLLSLCHKLPTRWLLLHLSHLDGLDCLIPWAKGDLSFHMLVLWHTRSWTPEIVCSGGHGKFLITGFDSGLWLHMGYVDVEPASGRRKKKKNNPASSEYKVQAAPRNSFTRICVELIPSPIIPGVSEKPWLTSPYIWLLSHFTSVCVGFNL